MIDMKWNDIKIILPEDKKTLDRWLTQLNLTVMILAVPFVVSVVLMLLAGDMLNFMRFGFLAVIILICASVLTVLEYLLAIEFNTRRK